MDEEKSHDRIAEPSLPTPKSTNNGASPLSATMKRLSLATAAATELPPSSPGSASYERFLAESVPHSPIKLRKSPSATSLGSNSRSATPTLKKRTSLSSLKGAGSTPPRSPLLRRQSSNIALSSHSGMTSKPLESPAEESPPPLPPTEASVARDFFRTEIESHNTATSQSDLLVIIHDACYGHRYSRPRTPKSTLMTIVERPERILATVLGVSAAYVRFGGRHFGSEHMPRPGYNTESIPFKIQKSNRFVPLVSPAVTNVHGTKWMSELKMMCEGAEAKLAMGGKELERPSITSDADVEDRPELHSGDLYLCSESLNALEGSLGGVFDAIDSVFDPLGPKRAFVAIRPPGHHCSDNYPSGFCWINNVHVGISHASSVHGLTHAAIIDFDLHHGDGSQSITWDHNERVSKLPKNAAFSKRTAIGYFSLHDINSYPCEWGDREKVQNASLCIENAHGQNIWNVHLQPWKTEDEFWKLYETRYNVLLEKTRAFLQNQRDRLQSSANAPDPRAAIFISAGFDASEWEGQGMQRHKVNVPTDFYARFTKDINDLADEEGLGVNGRVISVLEGGYSDRALTSGVLSHISGMVRQSKNLSTKAISNGLAHEMGQRLHSMDTEETKDPALMSYDPNWWSSGSLQDLENLVNPPPPAPPRKPKGPVNPTYTTPTQSFVAKVVPVVRRSISGSLAAAAASRPVVEVPPPDVGWVTATHELSKILIPDRQTKSCKPEDLNAKASEARRNRQSAIDDQPQPQPQPQIEDGKRMQLRGRRAKAPPAEPESRPASRASRRTTIGGPDGTSDDGEASRSKAPRRRVSVASTIVSTAEEGSEALPGLQGVRRRQSSSSIARPSSAASNRSNVPLEKARARPRSPPKAKAPKRTSTASRPQVARTSSTASQASKAGSDSKVSDVDALTSGVKKMSIKLNLPPKAEQEAREAKAKAARAPRKGAIGVKTAKKSNPTTPTSAGLPPVAEAEVTHSGTSTNVPPVPPVPPIGQHLAPSANPASMPVIQPDILAQPMLNASLNDKLAPDTQSNPDSQKHHIGKENIPTHQDMPPSFLPPRPDPIPAPATKANAEATNVLSGIYPNQTLPGQRNDGAPESPQLRAPGSQSTPKRSRLPVFTSTSPIPFAPPSQGMSQVLAAEAKAHPEISAPGAAIQDQKSNDNGSSKDIWDIPESPRQRVSQS